MQGRKQHSEKLFFTFQLSDHVPEENFYRRLKEMLDLKWLYRKTAKYYGTEGQESIDPVVFFKLILIGYLENLGSDRCIIATASMRLDMLYFLGYDIDEPLPWHSTVSRTRKLYGEEVFKDLFKEVLKGCIDKGMVSGKRQAVDSVFVKANASMDSLVEKEILNDADNYADELTEDEKTPVLKPSEQKKDEPTVLKPVKQKEDEPAVLKAIEQKEDHPAVLRAVKQKEDKAADKPTVSEQKNKIVQQHHNWKKKAYKDMPGGRKQNEQGNGEEDKFLPKFVSNHTHYSTTDADARVSVKPGKPRQLNYLAQVSVDTASHVITNIEAHHADKKDSQCLGEVVNNTVENLQKEGLRVEEVLADGGYSSAEALQALEDKNITGYIPNFGQYKADRSAEGFVYNKEGDYYQCTRGTKIIYKITRTDSKGYTKKVYRSSAKDCGNCPLRSVCIGKSDFKKIEDTVDKALYDRMHQRLQTPKAKRLKKLRSATVEPVIGTLVNFLAMKRVNTRGIKQANKCMIMAAVAYNLKKLLNYKGSKSIAGAKTIKIKAKTAFLSLFTIYTSYSPGVKLIIAAAIEVNTNSSNLMLQRYNNQF
jgi:transposase